MHAGLSARASSSPDGSYVTAKSAVTRHRAHWSQRPLGDSWVMSVSLSAEYFRQIEPRTLEGRRGSN